VQEIDSGVSISNMNGWQSHAYEYNSHEFMKATLDDLINKMIPIYYQFGLGIPKVSNYWFNINKKDSFNTAHNHPHSYFSGVLYVKAPEDSGSLVFERPDMLQDYIVPVRNTEKNYRSWQINPQENMLILFPAWLYHYVEPNNSNNDRVSIALNFI
jgi:uncharacterized protein (TIGR02466 family)